MFDAKDFAETQERPSKFVKQTDLKIGLVAVVNLNFPGLSKSLSTALYFRDSAVKLVHHLCTYKRTLVQGPPGSGKSSMVWYWAFQVLENRTVYWVHLRRYATVCWWSEGQMYKQKMDVGLLDDFLRNLRTQILIIDGITRTTPSHELIVSIALSRVDEFEKLVLVSSLQYELKLEDRDVDQFYPFNMPSWDLDEYISAYQSPGFADSIPANILTVGVENEDQTSALNNKYVYAGGSARWMFGFPLADVRTDINFYIQKISAISNWFKDGFVGIRSDTSVSHLFSVNKDGKGFIVSEYVGRRLSEYCEASFFAQARLSDLCKRNPTFDGWIFEADFLYQVRIADNSGLPLVVQRNFEHATSWEAKERRSFYELKDIVTSETDTLENVWYIPEKWNQACFDAVHIRPGYCFSFIQVTLAFTHSLKLVHIVNFLNRFEGKVKSVEICFVVPNNSKYGDFKIKYPEGSLGEYKSLLKKDENGDEWALFGLDRTG
jgi:hypothetical protein